MYFSLCRVIVRKFTDKEYNNPIFKTALFTYQFKLRRVNREILHKTIPFYTGTYMIPEEIGHNLNMYLSILKGLIPKFLRNISIYIKIYTCLILCT